MSLKYIKKVPNHTEFEKIITSSFNDDYKECVVRCESENHTHYNVSGKMDGPSDCVQFTAIGGSSSIGYKKNHNINPNMKYSNDRQTWKTWTGNNVTISDGESLYVKGNNPNGLNNSIDYINFTISNNTTCKGNIMALLGENVTDIPQHSCFYMLFNGCTKLLTAPALPATTLAPSCYAFMFKNCTSLTTAPALPATTLASRCYDQMFSYCTSLTVAPVLPATTLVDYCYNSMFYCCYKLNYVKAMFTTEPGSSYTDYWLTGVSSDGIFEKNPNATWDTGLSRSGSTVPTGWDIIPASS